jgi:hypothetical protein
MLATLLHRLTRPFAQLWVTQSAQSWRTLPVPIDSPLAHAPGVDPDRILLIGSGPAISYGVMSYNLGLAGHLARKLAALTGRGASVYVRADPNMTVPDAIAILRSMELSRFDAIVATFGGLEAMTLYPPRKWRAQLDDFIAESPTPLFLVGVAPISSIVRMPRLFGAIVTAHSRRINAQADAAARAGTDATFVPFFPKPGDTVSQANRATYSEWAELIAPAVSVALIDGEPWRNSRPLPAEDARQRSLDAMEIVELPQDDELQRIVETVRDLFGAAGAGVNLIDRARQRVLAAAGMSRADRPRDETLCNATITRGELFVVDDPDAYTGEPWANAVGPIKFYAGYPIESPDGFRIGALCIVDTKRRSFDDADRALLRDLAMHTQSVLWERQFRQ